MRAEEFHHPGGVAHVTLHPQRQRFDALQDQPGGVRAHAGAEIAQPLPTRAQQESADRRFLAEDHVVEAFVRRGELGETSSGLLTLPVETAAVHDHAADDGAVSRQELGGGVVDQVGAEIQRLHQVRRCQRRIDQQRHSCVMGDRAHPRNVEHVQAGVPDGFAEQELGGGTHRCAPAVDVARLDECRLDAEPAHGVVQQVLGAAVKRGRRHDVRPRAHQRGDRQMQRRLAAGRGDRANAAFERCHPLFEHRIGRIADPRIDVARALEVEQRGGVVAGFEHEGGGEVDRHSARARRRVG